MDGRQFRIRIYVGLAGGFAHRKNIKKKEGKIKCNLRVTIPVPATPICMIAADSRQRQWLPYGFTCIKARLVAAPRRERLGRSNERRCYCCCDISCF